MNTTKSQALHAVKNGDTVVCPKEEWPSVRAAIMAHVEGLTARGQHLRSSIAMREVKRLDEMHGERP